MDNTAQIIELTVFFILICDPFMFFYKKDKIKAPSAESADAQKAEIPCPYPEMSAALQLPKSLLQGTER
jgi:hypothetical protein